MNQLPKKRTKTPLRVRQLALEVLGQVDQHNRTVDQVLEQTLASSGLGVKRDRALLHALTLGIARWRGRLDFIIGRCSRTPLEKIDPPVLNVLRLGLFQLVFLNRIPQSAAVNTSVELAKQFAPNWVVRYVNAVLRRAAEDWKRIPLPEISADPVAAIAVGKSFPEWLVKRWLKRYGPDETIRRCDLLNEIPPITVRTNTLRTTRSELISALAGEAKIVEPTAVAPDGIRLTSIRCAVHEIPAFQQGWFQVQDEAAQLVTLLLPLQPGDSVLDACAGLGGKTGHIAQRTKNQGSVIAVDNSEFRLNRLTGQMRQMGFGNVLTTACDLTDASGLDAVGSFDRILLDAPCSGLGVLRRNPDAKWKIQESMLRRFSQIQSTFLENLARLVNPQGHLVYAVCSSEPEEGLSVVDHFVSRHPEFSIDNPSARLPVQADSLVESDGTFTTQRFPEIMDGFFAVCFRRTL